jgi:hypothetical protein
MDVFPSALKFLQDKTGQTIDQSVDRHTHSMHIFDCDVEPPYSRENAKAHMQHSGTHESNSQQ